MLAQRRRVSIPLVGVFQRTFAEFCARSYLICMYALFRRLLSVLTIENKLTFLGFIPLSSEPVEKTRRRSLEVGPYSQAVNPSP